MMHGTCGALDPGHEKRGEVHEMSVFGSLNFCSPVFLQKPLRGRGTGKQATTSATLTHAMG